jgi:hypothetical protein|nr:MAG TPA: HNH endonuclease [Caudoviricetes sp.]
MCKCKICGKAMYLKPSRLKRVKNGITCSKECASKLKSEYMKGEGNHQFGLIGDKNASYKDSDLITNYGYLLEYCPGHPYPHDKSNKTTRVLQHRLVVERNSNMFDDSYFEVIDGWKVLKPEYDVHHINEDKQDNRIENLQVLLRSEHSTYHNLQREIIRDELGRIIGVVKSSNIGESCDANPEINSEISQGSESSYSVEGE